MHKNFLLLAITTFLLFASNAYAAKEDFVFFDLSLAGYRIGMTYDEAAAVRPFHYVGDLRTPRMGEPYYTAGIDHIYVDEVEMNLSVDFFDDKVQKIIGKFHPSEIDDMIRRFHIALGQSENKSRIITDKNGIEYRQAVYRWGFPNAKMYLVGISSNSEFAVVGLVAKEEKEQSEQVEGDE